MVLIHLAADGEDLGDSNLIIFLRDQKLRIKLLIEILWRESYLIQSKL